MRKSIFLFLFIGIHLLLLFNLQYTAWPEMLSYPYLRNNGYLLYKDMIHPYPPVLTMGLSIVYKLFGYKLEVLKIVTWLVIIANDVLVYAILRKLTKKENIALVAVLAYALIQPFLEGNMLWFDLAIVPCVLFGIYFFLDKKDSKSLFLSGVGFAVAALIKQTSGLYLLINGIYLLFQRKIKGLIFFSLGSLVMGLLLLIRLWTESAVSGFFNWTLIYPFTYWSKFPGYVQMELSRGQWLTMTLLFLPIFIGGVISKGKIFKDGKFRLLLVYLLSSLIMIYPRFSFFHFQLGLALIIIISGYVYALTRSKIYVYSLLGTMLLLLSFVVKPIFISNWGKEARFWSFSEVKTGQEIKDISSEKVFLLGPQSGLYVFSETLPPKPWTDNFGWYLEIPGVQEEIIQRWESDPPGTVFTRKYTDSGPWYGLGTYTPQEISEWIRSNYVLTGELRDNMLVWQRK